jgi:F0F1-type ATP synthase assembly protein I
MEKNNVKVVEKNRISTFYLLVQASKITFKLVFIPILLLFFGLFIDKTLDTTPLFLAIGCIAGLFFAFYKVRSIRKNFTVK